MNWKNAAKDELPQNEQEVLICVSGIYYVAIFKTEPEGFEISEHDGFIHLKHAPIYWTEIPVPKHS
jgi:hypothetical protein